MSDNTKLNRDGLNQVWLKAMTILKSLTGNVRTDKGTLQEQIDKLEENASSGVDLTQAEYDALPDSKETDGVDYYITDEDFVATDAKAVGYDNTASGLAAKTVQVAVDEVAGKVNEVSENYAQKTQITNPNLLDNPWFTVNQRGVTEYTSSSHGVDRWYVGANDTRKFTICSNGIKIESISPNISNNTFFQKFLAKELGLGGKTVTISAMVAEASEGAYLDIGVRKGRNFGETKQDWTAIAGAVNISVKTGDIITKTFIIPEDCNDVMLFDAELSNKPQPIGTYVIIRAVKLEVGSISTLALDAAPNYQQELAKCQRYYQRYNGSRIALFGYAYNTDGARIYFPGIEMRDTPKVSFNNLNLYRHGNSALTNTAGIKSVGGVINHPGVKSIMITPETNIFEMGDVVMLSNKTDAENPYIDFSADL